MVLPVWNQKHSDQLSLPSLRGRWIEYQPVWLGLKCGMFTCVEWQATICDPIWQVSLRSSEMRFLWRAIQTFLYSINNRYTLWKCGVSEYVELSRCQCADWQWRRHPRDLVKCTGLVRRSPHTHYSIRYTLSQEFFLRTIAHFTLNQKFFSATTWHAVASLVSGY